MVAGVYEPSVATLQPGRLALGLRRVARERGVRRVILNLSEVTWVNSCGTGILLGGYVLAKRNGVPPLWPREPGFATLLRLVLEQQVSLASANAACAAS